MVIILIIKNWIKPFWLSKFNLEFINENYV